jgi:hypothetical protein
MYAVFYSSCLVPAVLAHFLVLHRRADVENASRGYHHSQNKTWSPFYTPIFKSFTGAIDHPGGELYLRLPVVS